MKWEIKDIQLFNQLAKHAVNHRTLGDLDGLPFGTLLERARSDSSAYHKRTLPATTAEHSTWNFKTKRTHYEKSKK